MIAGLAKLLALCLLARLVVAHMEMSDPAPLKSKNNPNAGFDVDYDLVAPISGDAFPCKGYLSLLGSPAGAPVATYQAGSTQSFSIVGGAAHGGGSCQISLSLDDGETFTVIHSYIGGCPTASGGSFEFRVPSDTPASDQAILSWSWLNNIGNREFYQNCAVITIEAGKEGGEKIPFDQRPAMLTANLGDGCTTAPSADVMFPDPGPDADINNSNAVQPVGVCGKSGGVTIGDIPSGSEAAPRNEDWTSGPSDEDQKKIRAKPSDGLSDEQIGAILLGAALGVVAVDVQDGIAAVREWIG